MVFVGLILLAIAGMFFILLIFGLMYYAWPLFAIFGIYLIYKERNRAREAERQELSKGSTPKSC